LSRTTLAGSRDGVNERFGDDDPNQRPLDSKPNERGTRVATSRFAGHSRWLGTSTAAPRRRIVRRPLTTRTSARNRLHVSRHRMNECATDLSGATVDLDDATSWQLIGACPCGKASGNSRPPEVAGAPSVTRRARRRRPGAPTSATRAYSPRCGPARRPGPSTSAL